MFNNCKSYVVSNITINNNKEYETKLPIEYCESSWLAKIYLRTELFNKLKIDYVVTELPYKNYQTLNTADYNAEQPYDINIYDACTAGFREYKETVDTQVFLAYSSSIVLSITDKEIVDAATLEQAAFEQLLYKLPVDFCYIEDFKNAK